jgi:hypothetical protein
MSLADPFASPKLRISRAKAQMEDLDRKIRAYFAGVNETRVTEKNDEGDDVVKVRLDKPFPDEFSAIAFESIESLRSALDHAAFATAAVGGKINAKSAYFPIADDASGLEDVIKRKKCKDIVPEMVDFFRSLKPYKGGNDAIWSLNKMCNASKHRFIVPVGKHIGTFQLSQFSMKASATGYARMMFPTWDTEKDEMVLFVISPGSKVEGDVRLSYQIVFGNVEPFAGNEIFGTLRSLAAVIDDTVSSIEAECRRLGLVN